MRKPWLACWIAALMTYSAYAEEMPSWPSAKVLETGMCTTSQKICYSVDDAVKIAKWQRVCREYKANYEECANYAESAIRPVSWYSSKWFYLSLGLVVGVGTVFAVRAVK